MMAPVKKSTGNPKRATLSDTGGKRDQLINEMEKLGEYNWFYILVSILGFLVFKNITKNKTFWKGLNYSALKSSYATLL